MDDPNVQAPDNGVNPIPGPLPGLDAGMEQGVNDAATAPAVPPPQAPNTMEQAEAQGSTQAPQMPQRPPGTSSLGQYQGSKSQIFRSILGDFLYSAGKGLAESGHGPEANARGAGEAIGALPERNIMRQQLANQAAQVQATAALKQQQSEYITPSIDMVDPDGKPIKIAPKDVPAAIAAKYKFAGQVAAAGIKAGSVAGTNASKEKIAEGQTASKEKIAGEQIGSKEKMAGATLDEKAAEFKSTDSYRKWKTQLDNDTKVRVADLTASKAPAAMLQTASFSDGALTMLNDADAAMKRLEAKGVFASNVFQNKAENWIFGKGLVDPSLDPETRKDIGTMRAAMGYTSTAAMRAHTGRTSREIYDDFKQRLGPGQDWSALRGAMDETRTLMTHYRDAATNANVRNLRTGGAPQKAGGVQGGEYDFVNGQLVPRKPK